MENSVVDGTNILTRVWANERRKKSFFDSQNTVYMLHTWSQFWIWNHGEKNKDTKRNDWNEKKPNTERAMADQSKTIAMNLNYSTSRQMKRLFDVRCLSLICWLMEMCGLTMVWSTELALSVDPSMTVVVCTLVNSMLCKMIEITRHIRQ